ncbi:MAG: L-glutamate gamma-semialdehyde dehydrogenase [Planctomycetes bacterium]|nr:L-glutamate gamma-semialdehyde dehydrogenase [Planctomycetota bacterium]
MTQSIHTPPPPTNDPIKTYAPGSPERAELKAAIAAQRGSPVEIPLLIGGKEVRTDRVVDVREPHAHARKLARAHLGDREHVQAAIQAATAASHEWSRMAFTDRAAIFLKAADLLAGPYRAAANAATMLGQSKTVVQAEIDSACELIDFFRFNVHYAAQILAQQPGSNAGMWNHVEYRNLEGFVLAVTPFNFTAIGGNLPTAPALMGNVVVWKPATTALHSNWVVMKILREAGLPDGVINFVPCDGPTLGDAALPHRDLAGVHFTGSTGVFNRMWKTVGESMANYKSYPRLVGETGGKDFVFAHPSADVDALVIALLRGAFEYQGQKCSAASRAYIPQSLWNVVRDRLVAETQKIAMGDVADFRTFMGAVIDEKSFDNCARYIDAAKAKGAKILTGGACDKSVGWFVPPTLIQSDDPRSVTMCDEIFGPILTVFVYADAKLDEALELCDTTSPYALTGAVFAQDRAAIVKMADRLRHAAGNFYVNDKPTGAVVGQQPFGGARASGTNDKAGSFLNLIRWTSVRTVKETFVPPKDWSYPHMREA